MIAYRRQILNIEKLQNNLQFIFEINYTASVKDLPLQQHTIDTLANSKIIFTFLDLKQVVR